MTHEEYADSLMKLAEWWRSHPEIELPHDAHEFKYFAAHNVEDAAKLSRALGTVRKSSDTTFFYLDHAFGAVNFRAYFTRNSVCERVQVGMERRPKTVTRTFETGETEEVPLYEWRCPDSLLNGGKVEQATD